MKKISILCACIFSSVFLWAQDNNSKAVTLYVQAEENYGKQAYSIAVDELNQALHLLNSPNSKLLFLKIKSLEPIYRSSREYTVDLDSSLNVFFRITDKASYPEEKYFDILKVKDQLDLFKQSDKKFTTGVSKQFDHAKTKQYPEIKSSVETYIRNNPHSFNLNELNAIVEKINRYNTAKANQAERKSYLNNAHTFTLISLGYGTPLGIQKENYKNVSSLTDVETLFNGGDYPLGAKYQLRIGLFDKAFPIYTNSVVQLGINWNFIDGEYISWDWNTNDIFTKTGASTTDFVKTINMLRLGTKIGPYLSTALAKTLRLDFYYNARPGLHMFLDPKEFNYRLVYGNNNFEDFQVKPVFKFSDVSVCHEFGVKLKYRHLVINPYYTFGKYNFSSTSTNLTDETAIRSSYKAKLGYGFAGISIGISL